MKRIANLSPAPHVGVRLHHARRVAGLTLKQLAAAAGCSESLLSKIEHAHTQPSLAMLDRIARALNSSVSELTDDSWRANSPVQRQGQRSTRLVPQKVGVLECEALAHADKGALLQGEIHHLAPGLRSDPQHHLGHILGYVLAGELELVVGDACYQLRTGDSLGFDANQVHHYQNLSDQYARLLWIRSPVKQ